ncbi:hypothetical protein EJ02DRAFT_417144 [Clathrospora elynae]|uniref:Histone chaperone domain-containing protein n=1 Tax=Clathrospora elynae TaxID=706981 RepID=A0A6A5TFF9_9PLEO|nr:hypothetical protein EJ02DRAFT_417144 [Clathrospora elynae]
MDNTRIPIIPNHTTTIININMSYTNQIPAGNAVDNDYQSPRGEKDAIDRSNIIEECTRGATKKSGTYTEPSDEEGFDEYIAGGQDGTSSGRQ